MLFLKKNIFLTYFILLLFSFNSWAQINTTTVHQFYCPLTEIGIVEDFSITDPTNTLISTLYIQISTGYINGKDLLSLNNPSSHPNITVDSFNSSEGKLTLHWTGSGVTNYPDLIAAVESVVFQSSDPNVSGTRTFSITIDNISYLALTDHYYEYVTDKWITWTDAKVAAENKFYWGRQGYLVTITSYEEAKLAGEQAPNSGWVGGSDAEAEGVWKWVTGPEAGSTFWFGLANGNSNGANYTYTNWAGGEPNDWPDGSSIPGQENYAHVYNSGKWNDYPNYNTDIQGYIVEYGKPGDPHLSTSASTEISISKINSTEGSTCYGGNATLSATATLGGTINWYDDSGNFRYTGNTYTTPSLTSTKTYYAEESVGLCRIPVIATVYTIPTITSTTYATICGAGTATLTATASAGTINWYDLPIGGILLGTGNSYSPTISTSTTYYVDATENNCTTATRTAVVANVQNTTAPTASATQTFCDIENATISNLTVTGNNIQWYSSATGGTSLNTSEILVNNASYYASQTVNGCESQTRLPVNVTVYETVVVPVNIPKISACDNASDGDDTNGFSTFDLTVNNTFLLSGKNAADFTFSYFSDASYLAISEISNPTNFINTVKDGQPIYVRIENNFDLTCLTETSFDIQVNPLPIIQTTATLLNCDEDGTPDGFTDFNLNEANNEITNGDTFLSVTYYLTFSEADAGTNPPINPAPFNSVTANIVYGRVVNTNGCHRVATLTLSVSTTRFPTGYMANLATCDADATIDGFEMFDLSQASAGIILQFPTGQNLSVHYFRNLSDAQLEQNEIIPQANYTNEVPFSQILYVRVESEDNGDCFGIGPHLKLTIYPRPQFELNATEIVCLNLPPITLAPYYEQGIYTYEWFNESGTLISDQPTVTISKGGIYTAIATSESNCKSFPQTVTVSESVIATITQEDISISDDSDSNTITINNQNNNLGIGEYEFSLDDIYGPYQDESVFEMVEPGIHTVFVQDKNNCGVASIEVSVIGFPNFFTPNNDGFNDTWQIKGVSSNFFPTSLIYIFDRFGKLITQIDATREGWDGAYNGENLPSTDYWFTAQLIDEDGNVREKKGHFSLIRK